MKAYTELAAAVLLLTNLTLCGCRQQNDIAELSVIGASDYSFGETMPGSVLEHTFKLRNNSRHDLQIEEVKTSCSCMALGSNVTGNASTLQPGDTFELRVKATSRVLPHSELESSRQVVSITLTGGEFHENFKREWFESS